MTKRLALYLRVSTAEQTVENQRRELAAVARRHGWRIVATFKDKGISGAKGRDKRPGYDRLLVGISRREFEMVAAWSIDRLGRSLQELVGFLGELHGKRIDLYLHQQGVDTSTPAGKAMFRMLGVFAEFERAIIVERIKAGLSRARAQGKRPGRRRIAADIERQVRKHLIAGMGIVKTAKTVGIGVSVAQRVRSSLTPAELASLRKERRSSEARRSMIVADAELQVRKHLLAGMAVAKAARAVGVGARMARRVRSSLTAAELASLRNARRSSEQQQPSSR